MEDSLESYLFHSSLVDIAITLLAEFIGRTEICNDCTSAVRLALGWIFVRVYVWAA